MLPYIASSFTLHPANLTASFLFLVYFILQSSVMTSEPQKLRVTEIKVRMDCNGCVQKIKKALHGIIGISELYIDFSKQKVIIVGWADPENIVKAIKKTRKSAVICSHTEQSEQSAEPSTEAPTEGGNPEGLPPPPDSNQAGESQQTEGVTPPEPHASDNPPPKPEQEPSPDSTGSARSQSNKPSPPKEPEEIHVVYHYPPDYGHRPPNGQNVQQGYGGPWHPHSGELRFREDPSQPPQPVFVSQNYNTYKPSPYMTGYKAPQPAPLSQSYNTYRPTPYMSESQPPQPTILSRSTYKPTPYMTEPQPAPLSHGYNTYRPTLYTAESQPPQPVSMSHYNAYKESPLVTESQPFQPVPASHIYNTYKPPMFMTESQLVQPVSVRHSYNTYKPSPYVTEYAHPRPPPDHYSQYSIPNNYVPETQGNNDNAYKPPPYASEYAYKQSPVNSYSRYGYGSPSPQRFYSHYTRPDNFSQEYYNGSHGNGSVTSIFSEENPNACTIV